MKFALVANDQANAIGMEWASQLRWETTDSAP